MKIAVIGLGYVGLPLALGFGKKYKTTIGFDTNEQRIKDLQEGIDSSGETLEADIKDSSVVFTSNYEDLRGYDFFVIGVPTPVDHNNHPDLSALVSASEMVAKVIAPGAKVVYESTVYPGVTEDICGSVIEKISGLKCGVDFKLGYTPERINPGDREHSLENVVKIISAQDDETLDCIEEVYSSVVKAGLHRTPCIKVAEAAKVIENVQRDLNIALMNELSMIFDRMEICTKEVLEAAGTKWNFLKFTPGLVGGHCIGVDPYYLTASAKQLGYHPEVILAGRRINDSMGRFVAQRVIKLMVNAGMSTRNARVAVLGITFKEDVSDIRNSRVPSIVTELKEFGCRPIVHDPIANQEEVQSEYGIELCNENELKDLDAIILCVAHQAYLKDLQAKVVPGLRKGGVLADIKSSIKQNTLRGDIVYWSL